MTTGSKESVNANLKEMEQTEPITIVAQCIDFRKVIQGQALLQTEYGLTNGDYYLLATAGAGRNPQILERVHKPAFVKIRNFINLPHLDCGFAKSRGDDSHNTHKKFELALENRFQNKNPHAEFHSHLLPVSEEDLKRHSCAATAIILGKPEIVKSTHETLAALNLADNHDEIARPFSLDVNDESIWEDLRVSLDLHHEPGDQKYTILIFDESEENAKMLVEKVREIAQGLEVEPRVIPHAA